MKDIEAARLMREMGEDEREEAIALAPNVIDARGLFPARPDTERAPAPPGKE
jgi:hypothetical protein